MRRNQTRPLRTQCRPRRVTMTPELDEFVLSVARIAARRTGASVVDVLSGRKGPAESAARRAVSYVLRRRLGLSTTIVADILSCNHSTVVLHAQQLPREMAEQVLGEVESIPHPVPKITLPARPEPPPRVKSVPMKRCPRCGGAILRDRDGEFCSEFCDEKDGN